MSLAEDLKITAKVSDFIEAYDFEVYDIFGVSCLFTKYRPTLFIIIGLYLAGIYLGQKWMENRQAYKLTTALFVWNLGLAVFSIMATLRGFPETLYLLGQRDGFYLAACSRTVHNYATSFWGLMFVLSKIVELGDTAFIVLRKQKLIILHWFHHVATLFVCWLGFEFYETGSRFYVINTLVHSFMYFYYALKVVKVKIPQKVSKALTMLQISQMVFFLIVVANYVRSIAAGKPCPLSYEMLALSGFIIFILTVLFVNFFVQTYLLKTTTKPKST